MKKAMILLLSVIFLSGCGMLEGGNYEKNRSGYVLDDNILISYHTNSIGEIDVFMIDMVISFYEALELMEFDGDNLDVDAVINNVVTEEELISCGITEITSLPKYIRLNRESYYFNVTDNGICSYDEYTFHKYGFESSIDDDYGDISPIEYSNVTVFTDPNFFINTFEQVLFIENISYNNLGDEWEKDIISAVPMSSRQSGDIYEENEQLFLELSIIENYVLNNQSVNLLDVKENYLDENVNNIWSDDTIDALGRDHEIIKTVRLKITKRILDVIEDTLSRLGMF